MSSEALGFFMLRKPMLSMDKLFDFNEIIKKCPESFEEELIRVFSLPFMQEAIYVASPSLYNSVLGLSQVNDDRSRSKILSSLYKYLIRMCTRATPYGLFSGFATGVLSDKTHISFCKNKAVTRHTRLDMEILAELSSRFQSRPHILKQTRFIVNSSLYKSGESYRYVERIKDEAGFKDLLCAVQTDAILEKVVASCQAGCTIDQLIPDLLDDMSAPGASQYVQALIQMQILVSEFEVNVTGDPHFDVLLGKFSSKPGAIKEALLLRAARKLLSSQGNRMSSLRKLESLISSQIRNIAGRPIIQTDLKFNTNRCLINQGVVSLLGKEFDHISRLFETENTSSDLGEFKKSFFLKYENREVPLLEALDCESGVGYGHLLPGTGHPPELIRNLHFPDRSEQSVTFTALSRFKERLADLGVIEKRYAIDLGDEDLTGLESPHGKTDSSFYWLGSFVTNSQKELDNGKFKFLMRAIGGPSGLELMGRFCYADTLLEDMVRKSASVQQQNSPDLVFAEIAHLPAARTANILSRPHLRDYEIVYLAGSSLPDKNLIYLRDLMVSVPEGRKVVIRSSRLQKQVIPCMATAHNYMTGLPAYKFLCDLARQGDSNFSTWDWGQLNSRPFLPRLEYKHFVISRATWNIEKSRYPALFDKKDSFELQWQSIRKNLNIPRYFQVCHADNELLVDSCNLRSLDLLRDILFRDGKARLVEMLQDPGESLLSEAGQHFAHEVVLPFRHIGQSSPASGVNFLESDQKIARSFVVGGQWLYVKIYVGVNGADRILMELIKPFLASMVLSDMIEKWFFIRYQDPAPHLRLRFYHGARPDFWHQVLGSLTKILAEMIQAGVVNRLQTDTYNREIERYAGLSFDLVESIFHADSEAVLSILTMSSSEPDPENQRWLAGLYGAGLLMDDFGVKPEDKVRLTGQLVARFLEEFQAGKDLTTQLDKQYRQHRTLLWDSMENCFPGLSEIFSLRSSRIREILHISAVDGPIPFTTIASFMHMFFNRLFSSDHRKQEFVAYYYLNKYYKSWVKMH
ncbi:MAG: hypothetical protein BGO21_00185 [Dyadobacter sp. 50-39]|mgnify:CR=1 FL=1|uniref:lantibiotic dehydratase n=1 Tax=Dyadobacter sp. 50-39 TaxID=1895756 RepID=UPI0009606ACF|nr:lantibiotic dehydratase [Dyadobacter sp. 50-39]OJV21695.1 MAG: hypothetical protein BGO21_00185 [Dyadobacter sp. 50-39]